MKFDPSVKREIGYVTLGTLLLTAVEIGVFFLCGYYTSKVLFGAILSAVGGILNFVLLAVTVTRVLTYSPEEEAADTQAEAPLSEDAEEAEEADPQTIREAALTVTSAIAASILLPP